MKVTVVIVSYNTAHLLPQCLDSVKSQKFSGKINVVIIDVGKDETEELIKKSYAWVDYISYPQNDGFGKANNLGMRKYYDQSDYFLILNPDTKLEQENLFKMVSFMETDKRVAILSCKLVLPNGKLDRGCKRGFPTPWKSMCRFLFLDRVFPKTKTFGGYNLTYLDENMTHEVDSVKGAYMLVRKSVINDVGMFDEDYWMYGEDLDWCYRMKQKNWKVVYHPGAKCIHYQGASSGLKKESKKITKASKKTQIKAIRAFHESMHIFYDKHYSNRYPWWVNRMVMFSVNIKMEIALLAAKIKKY